MFRLWIMLLHAPVQQDTLATLHTVARDSTEDDDDVRFSRLSLITDVWLQCLHKWNKPFYHKTTLTILSYLQATWYLDESLMFIVSFPVGYRGDAMRYCYSTMKTSLYKFRKAPFLNISWNMMRESWEGNENLVWLSSVSDSNWQYTWLFTKNWQSQTEMLLVPGLWPLNTFCCNIFTQLSINDHTIGYSTQQVVQNFTTRPCLPCFWC